MAVKSRLLVEAKSVAQQHIVEAILNDSDPASFIGNTLHSDATSKFFKHYQSFQVTLPDGKVMSIGLSEVGSGDANTLMKSFRLLVNELVDSSKPRTLQDTVNDLLSNIQKPLGIHHIRTLLFSLSVNYLKDLRILDLTKEA